MSNPLSATPFLDLVKPLPKPYDEGMRSRFSAPYLAAVACALVTKNYSLLAILVGAASINLLAVFVHEFGHLCAGWYVGYRFDGVTIGPVVVKRLRRGLSFRLRPRLGGGLAYMTPTRVRRIRRGAMTLTAGGPLASLLSGVAAVVASEIIRVHSDSAWLTFAGFFGLYSVFLGVVSCVPFRINHFANDAMLFRTFCRPGSDARAMIAAHALAALKNGNPEGIHWNARWVRSASQLSYNTPYHTSWYAYWAALDSPSADLLLEACLANSRWVEREYHSQLIAEAAKFSAWERCDYAKAKKWMELLGDIDQLDLLSQARLKVAVNSAAGNQREALLAIDRGLSLIQQSPPSMARREAEAAWKTWKAQIEARATAGSMASHEEIEVTTV